MLCCLIVLLALYRCTYIVHSILLYHQHSNNKMSRRFTTPIRIICTLRSQFFAPCYSSTPPYINLWKFLNITRISSTVIILNLDNRYDFIRTKSYVKIDKIRHNAVAFEFLKNHLIHSIILGYHLLSLE